MRTLAIDTATEACSVALFEGEAMTLLDRRHEMLGRGHAERLIPMIAELPDKGRADRILVSLGPGSFTGVRIGIASARALGIAWSATVLGYPTLTMIAACSWQQDLLNVTVCMNGGHGEWFVQNFSGGHAQDAPRSLTPEEAQLACRHRHIAGNRARELAGRFSQGAKEAIDLLPDASQACLLHETHLVSDLSPIYGRGPDATPQKARPA